MALDSMPRTDCGAGDGSTARPDQTLADRVWDQLRLHPHLAPQLDEHNFRQECLRLVAARRTNTTNPNSTQELVHCLTIGPPLFVAKPDSQRETRVYRVVVEEDMETQAVKDGGQPTLYALKDSWREVDRREEVDFYDVVAHYCAKNAIDMDKAGLARCHGSLDLAAPGPGLPDEWNTVLEAKAASGRHHMRTLLTPVGHPIKEFASTKQLIRALYNVVIHLEIAEKAGVRHRDVSSGNVLLVQDASSGVPGFLVDYDCAEFTETGVYHFNEWFSARPPAVWEESQKRLFMFVGTLEFMAIRLIEANWSWSAASSNDPAASDRSEHNDEEQNTDDDKDQNSDGEDDVVESEDASATPNPETTAYINPPNESDQTRSSTVRLSHGLHHDLESVYWVLLWVILRQMKHKHPKNKPCACRHAFDRVGTSESKKRVLLANWKSCVPVTPKRRNVALRRLLTSLSRLVKAQSPVGTPSRAPKHITGAEFRAIFETALISDEWAEDPAPPARRAKLVDVSSRVAESQPLRIQTNRSGNLSPVRLSIKRRLETVYPGFGFSETAQDTRVDYLESPM
ncbi:Protein kinase domain-containing protein [Mycena chlorophos]|uniref:Protein kinase domain-containing protein n=1 Tax=Mycena chlorophos TaxID=658473 RepID=A0A8H6W242_MYCCL|nr:Protein kinase domain-containing protein [Mycena chlorophos]